MSIYFRELSDIVIDVDYRGIHVATIYKWKAGRRQQIALHDLLDIEVLESILAKMKEPQSPNKDIEFLQADIASLGYLLDMSIERNDPIGKIQLSSRLETRKRELKELQSEVKK